MRTPPTWTTCAALAAGLLLGGLVADRLGRAAAPGAEGDPLPRFTEEREAAARHFVKKNLPELLSVLDQLQKANPAQYQREVRAIFHVTELLADLDPRRHDLELKVWKAENKAHILIAKLSTPNDAERKQIGEQLLELARELVELDVQVLELRAEQLDKELGEVKEELTRTRDNFDKHVRDRQDALLQKVKSPKRP